MRRSDKEWMIRRWQRGPTVWDRIGIAALYVFLSIPVFGLVFAIAALFHLLPSDWYQQ